MLSTDRALEDAVRATRTYGEHLALLARKSRVEAYYAGLEEGLKRCAESRDGEVFLRGTAERLSAAISEVRVQRDQDLLALMTVEP